MKLKNKLKNGVAAFLTIIALSVSLPPALYAAQSHHGEGTITAIDMPGDRIEIKHGPIKSIGWMAMKMSFNVDESDLLEDIKVGDKVDFEFIKSSDGRYVVIDLEPKD
ncbi:MAG: copper-binding protein [Mariprofundus sp.]